MPEMDGFAAAREIRRRHSQKQPPASPLAIIAITAGSAHDGVGDSDLEVFDSYLVKPVRLAAFQAALEEFLHTDSPDSPLDSSILAAMESLRVEVGRDALVEILDSFLRDTPPRLREMDRFLSTGALAELARAAHALAGSCSIFALQLPQQLALGLEDIAWAGEHEESRAALEKLKREISVLTPLLARALVDERAKCLPDLHPQGG
jgi:HPt (histidine-containing phosphotransfer) domain-containing protein